VSVFQSSAVKEPGGQVIAQHRLGFRAYMGSPFGMLAEGETVSLTAQ